jgi:hypothetical protein
MEDLIIQLFMYNDSIEPYVSKGQYDLVGPEGEVILPQVWEKVIEPGWTITMQMWPVFGSSSQAAEAPRVPRPPGLERAKNISDWGK